MENAILVYRIYSAFIIFLTLFFYCRIVLLKIKGKDNSWEIAVAINLTLTTLSSIAYFIACGLLLF